MTIKEKNFENFTWIDANRFNKDSIDELENKYDLNEYLVDDIEEIGHLPKFEKHKQFNFLLLRAYFCKAQEDDKVSNINTQFLTKKIAFFYNEDKLISIHGDEFCFFNDLGDDYTCVEDFLLTMVDNMVNSYEIPLQRMVDKNNELEETIFLNDDSSISLEDLYYQKAQARILKKILEITLETVNKMEVADRNKDKLKEIKDALPRLILGYSEVLDNALNILNTYISINGQKTNDIMKLLTSFSMFFLPLSFIVGLYGMNFENIPELKWSFGYLYALALMGGVSFAIYLWFRMRKIL